MMGLHCNKENNHHHGVNGHSAANMSPVVGSYLRLNKLLHLKNQHAKHKCICKYVHL